MKLQLDLKNGGFAVVPMSDIQGVHTVDDGANMRVILHNGRSYVSKGTEHLEMVKSFLKKRADNELTHR